MNEGVTEREAHVEEHRADDDRAGRPRPSSARWRPRGAAILAVALLATAVGVLGLAPTPDPAAADHCGGRWENGEFILNPCSHRPPSSIPGGSGDPGPRPTAPGGSNEPPPCPDWRPLGGYDSVPAHIRPYSWDVAPEGSTFYYDACTSPNGFGPGSSTMFLPPGAPAPAPVPPSPEEVAEGLWVQIEATLREPALATWPDQDDVAILDVPTFVAVPDWPSTSAETDSDGVIARSLCELGVCVSLTATPALEFDPGEPGADVVPCEPGGTRFRPDGPEPDVQARAPGACAHTYERRTGVRGRPATWPGEVSIVWDVHWEETGGGASDDFEVVLSTALARAVDEVQTVVEDVD